VKLQPLEVIAIVFVVVCGLFIEDAFKAKKEQESVAPALCLAFTSALLAGFFMMLVI